MLFLVALAILASGGVLLAPLVVAFTGATFNWV